MTPSLAFIRVAQGGQLVRKGRLVTRVPSSPTGVGGSQSGTTATVVWGEPVSDGGSPITGYTVTRVGGTTQNLGPAVRTASFTVVTDSSNVFTVAAVNAQGSSPTVPVTTGPGTSRFPGDPRTKVTGRAWIGVDENDQDPRVVGTGEKAAPEALAGVPVGMMRSYFRTSGADLADVMAVPNGPIVSRIKSMCADGRACWWSITIGNWAGAGDGRNRTVIYNLIQYIEEQLDVCTMATEAHEPENNLSAGSEADYGRALRAFRQGMNDYANDHGGVGVYQWKNLSFGPILTAGGYATGDGARGIGRFWKGAAHTTVTASAATDVFTSTTTHMLSNGCRVRLLAPPAGLAAGTDYFVVSATATTLKLSATRGGSPVNVTADATGVTIVYREVFDWMGVDTYQMPVNEDVTPGRTGAPLYTVNFGKAVAWCEDAAHTYPIMIGEYGVHVDDGDAGTQLAIGLEKYLNGAHDILAFCYFNSNEGNPDIAARHRWLLWNRRIADNGLNANLLDVLVDYLQDPRAVHFWDFGYTRPDGV